MIRDFPPNIPMFPGGAGRWGIPAGAAGEFMFPLRSGNEKKRVNDEWDKRIDKRDNTTRTQSNRTLYYANVMHHIRTR